MARTDAERQGSPEVQLGNVRTQALPTQLRRVLALPLCMPQASGEAPREYNSVFVTALGKSQRFETVTLSRADLAALTGREEMGVTDAMPMAMLDSLRKRFDADGLLLMEVTAWRPYRPMAIGVRARLLDMTTLRERWAADVVLDTANEQVSSAALEAAGRDKPYPGVVLQSPRRFAGFAADQIFSTLATR